MMSLLCVKRSLMLYLSTSSLESLGKTKAEEFFNLKEGRMSAIDYALKFTQLSYYSPELVSTMISHKS